MLLPHLTGGFPRAMLVKSDYGLRGEECVFL